MKKTIIRHSFFATGIATTHVQDSILEALYSVRITGHIEKFYVLTIENATIKEQKPMSIR